MILFAFILFALLFAGWLFAPSGREKTATKAAPSPAIQMVEAAA